MGEMVLVNDSEKYGGLFVATKSFLDKDVVTSGSDLVEVYNEAKKKGIENPVVFFVPEKGMVHIY